MTRINLLLLLVFISLTVSAQNISGKLTTEGKAASGATISLLRSNDSTVVKFTAAKEDGSYIFSDVKEGSYLLRISHIGYVTTHTGILTVESMDIVVPPVQLTKAATNLAAVTVQSTKPLVQVKADKTILNVEGTINAVGSDVLELLRKAPGVLVDKDENLSVSGKTGVQVYIDGRPTPLSGKDLADYLKSLQSSMVESIEIITNPSAKYEAAGNAGIINIRLKKNKSYGTNGTVNAGWGVGTYPKYNAGFSLNNRNSKSNIFGNYNYNWFKNQNEMHMMRMLRDTVFDQNNVMVFKGATHNYKAGVDFFMGKKSTIGFIINGTSNETLMESNSMTKISYYPTKTVTKYLDADNSNDMERSNTNVNMNYRYTDSTGKELNLDADHGFYKINSDQLQPNIYYDASHQIETHRNVYNMQSPSNIKLYSFKADYEQEYKKGRLGIGGKLAYVNTENDFKRYDVYPTYKEYDSSRSNRFDYRENINALYVNYNKAYKKYMVQLGVRIENTRSEGTSNGYKEVNNVHVPYDSSFNKKYIDVFPSVAITFNKNPMSQIGFTYSRRIDRPAYQDLNPFEFKLDDYTFMKGNTQLRPQYTNSFGITHSYKYKLTTTLNYSHVDDVFAQLVDTTEISKSFISKRNLATQDIISLNVSYPYSYKKYSIFTNFNTYYSMYKANFGEGKKIDINVFSINIYAQQSLKLSKKWTAEMSGWFSSPSVWQGTFKTESMGGVDIGVQRVVLKGKGNVKASFTDVFHTMQWRASSEYNGQISKGGGSWESQQLKLNFSYRFGNAEVKAARQRKNALEEEAKRTQQSGGLGQ